MAKGIAAARTAGQEVKLQQTVSLGQSYSIKHKLESCFVWSWVSRTALNMKACILFFLEGEVGELQNNLVHLPYVGTPECTSLEQQARISAYFSYIYSAWLAVGSESGQDHHVGNGALTIKYILVNVKTGVFYLFRTTLSCLLLCCHTYLPLAGSFFSRNVVFFI